MRIFRWLKVLVIVLLAYRLHKRGWTTRLVAKRGHCHHCGRRLTKPLTKFCPKRRCRS